MFNLKLNNLISLFGIIALFPITNKITTIFNLISCL
jgi:hypothetical protein